MSVDPGEQSRGAFEAIRRERLRWLFGVMAGAILIAVIPPARLGGDAVEGLDLEGIYHGSLLAIVLASVVLRRVLVSRARVVAAGDRVERQRRGLAVGAWLGGLALLAALGYRLLGAADLRALAPAVVAAVALAWLAIPRRIDFPEFEAPWADDDTPADGR